MACKGEMDGHREEGRLQAEQELSSTCNEKQEGALISLPALNFGHGNLV